MMKDDEDESETKTPDTIDRAELAKKGSPYLSTKQAAHYLGLRVNTLAKMRVNRQGPHYRRHGRHCFYHIDELERWSKEPKP